MNSRQREKTNKQTRKITSKYDTFNNCRNFAYVSNWANQMEFIWLRVSQPGKRCAPRDQSKHGNDIRNPILFTTCQRCLNITTCFGVSIDLSILCSASWHNFFLFAIDYHSVATFHVNDKQWEIGKDLKQNTQNNLH